MFTVCNAAALCWLAEKATSHLPFTYVERICLEKDHLLHFCSWLARTRVYGDFLVFDRQEATCDQEV